jgi:uncharacterized membrane protein YhaH (DUF805 family)
MVRAHSTAEQTDPFAETMPPWRMLLDPRGRIARREFWLWGLGFPIGVACVLNALAGIARLPAKEAGLAVNLLLLWPFLAVAAKRWQDRNRPPWWALVAVIPFVGWVWTLVVCGFLRGTPGVNGYGPDPLATRRAAPGRVSTAP